MDRETEDLWKRLETDYERLKALVVIQRTELSHEIVEHPERHREVRECWVYAKRIFTMAIREKATCFAEVSSTARQEQTQDHIADPKNPKCSKDTVDQAARTNDDYLAKCRQLVDAEELVGLWEGLAESMHGRGFRLRDLVTVHVAGMDRDYIKDEPPKRRAYQEMQSGSAAPPVSIPQVSSRRRRISDV